MVWDAPNLQTYRSIVDAFTGHIGAMRTRARKMKQKSTPVYRGDEFMKGLYLDVQLLVGGKVHHN